MGEFCVVLEEKLCSLQKSSDSHVIMGIQKQGGPQETSVTFFYKARANTTCKVVPRIWLPLLQLSGRLIKDGQPLSYQVSCSGAIIAP